MPTSYNWLGAWSAATAYLVNDLVSQGNAAYVATAPSTNKQPPLAGFWSLLVSTPTSGFITVAEYKAAHISRATAYEGKFSDDELQQMINAASVYLASQCNQPIARVNDIEPLNVDSQRCHVDQRGWLRIYPRFFPVQAVNSIKWRFTPTQAWADASVFAATAYTVEQLAQSAYSWGAEIIIPEVNPFRRGDFGEVLLNYDAGYTVPTDVPADLKQATKTLVSVFVAGGWAATDPGKGSKDFIPKRLEEYIERTLQPYKRRF